jgi:hypothetical protein
MSHSHPRYPFTQVPAGARHRDQLGRHGKGLAPHLLQRAARGARGPPLPAHRSAAQPQGQPRENDPDLLRDLQLTGRLRRHPSRHVPVRLWPHHRLGHGLGRWCLAHRARLRGLRAAARHRPHGPGRPRLDRLLDEDLDRARLLTHHVG